MSKFVNPTKVITGPNTRWSYANVWEAKSINGGTPKFSVSLIIPKTDTVTVQKIKAAIQAAYEEGQAKLKHGHGRYQHLRARHSDDGRCRGGNAVDFHSHIALVIHEHIVDLSRCHAVSAGTIDPYGDVSAAGHELVLEKLRGDIIVKPAFLGDGPVQEQGSFLYLFLRLRVRFRLVLPIPELLHRFLPPFRHR